MVEKKSRIAKKPATPTPDDWIAAGGTDPEVTAPAPEPVVTPEPPAETKRKGRATGGKYPHRISFDMDGKQYKRLKRAAFEEEMPMNEILRQAVEEWLKARDY